MKRELNKLMKLVGTKEFDNELEKMYDKYKDNKAAKAEIAAFIKTGIATSAEKIDHVAIKMQLADISDMITLSYIAQHYFKKTKAWLSQRVNAHAVNGKPAQFT